MTRAGNKWKDIQCGGTGALARLVCGAMAIPVRGGDDFLAATEKLLLRAHKVRGQDSAPSGTHILKLREEKSPRKGQATSAAEVC